MATKGATKSVSAKGSTNDRTSSRKRVARTEAESLPRHGKESNGSEGQPGTISLFERVEVATFLKTSESLRELARNPFFIIDVRYSDQQVLRALTGSSGSGWFDIPAAAVKSLTPLALSGGDPTKIVTSIVFRSEFQTLARTFAQLSSRAEGFTAPGIVSFDERERQQYLNRFEFGATTYDAEAADEDPASPAPDDVSRFK